MSKKVIHIKKLGNKDLLLFQKLILLFSNVFEMDNNASAKKSYLKSLLSNTAFIALVIFHEDEIVGGLTAYELPLYYAEYSEIYIYDVAIKRQFQRMGFGNKLLSSLKKYCRKNTIKEFFVEAHEEDKHSVSFYHSAGGKAEKVIHFNFEP
jgi:aminoglycoside 3-N-acetyltransferase I